jgi:hypothetical protein
VGAIERDDGTIVVIHALQLRRRYRVALEEMLRW